MEKPKRDIVSTVLTVCKVAFLHIGFGIVLSAVPAIGVYVFTPDRFPLQFWSGLLCGSPAAYLFLRLAGADKTLTALQSCGIGAILCIVTQVIGTWTWFALMSHGVTAYSISFFTGLAFAACLPFYAYALVTSAST